MTQQFPMLAMHNRKIVLGKEEVGCYSCLETFDPKEITGWTDKKETALCPKCGIDSVVPETDKVLLESGRNLWFGPPDEGEVNS